MKVDRNKWLVIGGCIFTVCGFGIGFLVLRDYWVIKSNIHFSEDSKFEDLGSVLSGTAGVFFTIASVLFFTYSLYQTNKEMNETQSIMKRQLSESTFFNLIKHHRELVRSFEGDFSFNDKMKVIISQLEAFSVCLNSRTFQTFSQTLLSPAPIYLENQTVKIVGASLVHISKLIRNKLDNENFYHTTFYSGLSDNERFLIGMIFENSLEETSGKPTFDYSEFFLANSPFKNEQQSRYFPPIKITSKLSGNFRLEGLNPGYAKMAEKQIREVTEIVLYNPGGAKLNRIECFIDQKPGNFILSFKNQEAISLYDFFQGRLIDEIGNEQPVIITAKFVFTFKKEEFIVEGFKVRVWAKSAGRIYDVGISRMF